MDGTCCSARLGRRAAPAPSPSTGRTSAAAAPTNRSTSRASVRGFPGDVSSDGPFVVFHNLTRRGYDIGGASIVPRQRPVDFLSTPLQRSATALFSRSPIGGVRVRRVGPVRGLRPRVAVGRGSDAVSIGGGMQPEWRRDGKELFYLSADRKIMAVPIATDGRTVTVATPQPLFPRRRGRAGRAFPQRLHGQRRRAAVRRDR